MTKNRITSLPRMVMADEKGNVFEHPRYLSVGASGRHRRKPLLDEMIRIPPGTDLFVLPGRRPVGFDPWSGKMRTVQRYRGRPVFSVAAFLPPAYTALLWSSFERTDGAPVLPLYAYAHLGWHEGGFTTAAVRVDPDSRQDPEDFPADGAEDVNARDAARKNPGNRLIGHLAHCCVTYRCPAARNLFLARFEAPLPTSPTCNARCIGCISCQESQYVSPSHKRIAFVPAVDEIVEIAVPHLQRARHAVASFGQGCEGEPLMQGDLIESAIRAIRERTTRGTINLNTNGSRPEILERLFDAGLDSIRVSLNSARKDYYHRYFKPVDYRFDDVLESMAMGVSKGRFVSINYFVFPGVTDEEEEASALEELLRKVKPHMIQWRNLNIDPDIYMDSLGFTGCGRAVGMKNLMDRIRKGFPELRFGYFNPALRESLPDGT